MRPEMYSFAAYPSVRIAICFAAGILFGSQLHYEVLPYAGVLAALIFLLPLMTKTVFADRFYSLQYLFEICSYLLLIVISGCIVYLSAYDSREQVKRAYFRSFEWEEIEITGRILERADKNSGLRLKIETDSIGLQNGHRYHLKSTILLTGVQKSLEAGTYVRTNGKVIPIRPPANPHDFDFRAWLNRENILLQLKSTSEAVVLEGESKSLSWTALRSSLQSRIHILFPVKSRALAQALVTGNKTDLHPEIRQAFSRVGLSHIMAVSGLHVGFLLAPFWMLIPYVWSYRGLKIVLGLLLILFLYTYCGITGFSESVVRASIMGAVLFAARLFFRISRPVNLTSLAALLILIVRPESLFSIGFQLSFSAVYIILMILPMVENRIPTSLRYRWFSPLLTTALVSFVLQIGLFPVQVYYFNEVSLVSPLSNLIFVPLLSFFLPLSLICTLISYVLPDPAIFINHLNSWYFNVMIYYSEWIAGSELAWKSFSLSNPLIWAVWLSGILFMSHFRFRRVRWPLLCLFLGSLIACQGYEIGMIRTQNKLEVTYFDVGQGDAALIQSPGDSNILIDTGIWSPGYNSSGLILDHLQKEGIQKLDAVILSHPHADHIGGITGLIESIPIDTIFNSGFVYESSLYKNYLRLASEYGIPVRSLKAGDVLRPDPTILIPIYAPGPHYQGRDANEHSVVLEVIYGETEFLFTGDAEHESEEWLQDFYPDFADTDVLKAGHHGSRTSSGHHFLEILSPERVVVSCALRNKFRHPHKETVIKLHQHTEMIHYTALQGAVRLQSDGKEVKEVKWRVDILK